VPKKKNRLVRSGAPPLAKLRVSSGDVHSAAETVLSQPGDTLRAIAKRHGADLDDVVFFNRRFLTPCEPDASLAPRTPVRVPLVPKDAKAAACVVEARDTRSLVHFDAAPGEPSSDGMWSTACAGKPRSRSPGSWASTRARSSPSTRPSLR